MKLVIVSGAYESIQNFFLKQGSFEIPYAIDSVTSHLDRLMGNIVHVDKFLIVVTDSMDFASEIRSLLVLLESPSALLRIGELAFFFRSDMNTQHIKQYIGVVVDFLRTHGKSELFVSSHELKSLSFDTLYRELLGKSSSVLVDPKAKLKYREERGNESRKAFEPTTEMISISPFDDVNMRNHESLKELLRKTENPASLTALDTLIPEYEKLKLIEFHDLGYAENRWMIVSGDRRSGSTTHAAALAISAARAEKSVLIADFSTTGDICECLKVANFQHYVMTAKEMLDNSIVLVEDLIAVYVNKNKEVLRTLLSYMQARPNVFDRDLVIVLADMADLELVFGSVNRQLCSLILSSLMFPAAVDKTLSIETNGMRTLVWLNDNISSPLRMNKLTMDIIRGRGREAGKDHKFMDPIFFEDFEVDARLYSDIARALE